MRPKIRSLPSHRERPISRGLKEARDFQAEVKESIRRFDDFIEKAKKGGR